MLSPSPGGDWCWCPTSCCMLPCPLIISCCWICCCCWWCCCSCCCWRGWSWCVCMTGPDHRPDTWPPPDSILSTESWNKTYDQRWRKIFGNHWPPKNWINLWERQVTIIKHPRIQFSVPLHLLGQLRTINWGIVYHKSSHVINSPTSIYILK